ncbi:phosphoglycerate mutase-like protein [Scenedesmus sp. NREL 46B-D3]|nr:phosphoglycerate mutase-like protein [Scenedesmus sp. NREL 46B-D3]
MLLTRSVSGQRSQCIGLQGQKRSWLRCVAVSSAATEVAATEFEWKGSDEFSALEDRKDLPPLPLPPIKTHRRVVLVRHGQSTWNAEGRIQGSSNFSCLTPKGIAQAETTRDMLKNDVQKFDTLYVSPLTRATQTADIITSGMGLRSVTLPSLREIDLFSFQGLLKGEGRLRYGDAWGMWQKQADAFATDGHAPVRELWYRASLAWQDILSDKDSPEKAVMVVAHNAVNQALIGSALGLPPRYFRRLLQSNAATTVLDFQPGPTDSSTPRVTVDRLNQSPGRPYAADAGGRPPCGRLVLIRHAATDADAKGLLLGSRDEPLNGLGNVQAGKVAEFLLDMKVHSVMTSPARRCLSTAQLVAQLQVEASRMGSAVAAGSQASKPPRVLVMPELRNLEMGMWEGQSMRMVADRGGLPAAAATAAAGAAGPALAPDSPGYSAGLEDLGEFWYRTAAAWNKLLDAVDHNGGSNVVVVCHAATAAALASHCLQLGPEGLPLMRFDAAGVSIIDFPDGARSGGVMRCLNYTAHLGRWAVPITRDDMDMVCGIDGCF